MIDNGETQPPFFISKGFMADAAFFQVFSYQFLYGNPLTALKEPNSVVLSDVVAQKLFGKANPLNRTLRIGNNYGENDYRVTGVFQSKGNSHIDAHFLLICKAVHSDNG
jgi:putative ABC transport system permease protein